MKRLIALSSVLLSLSFALPSQAALFGCRVKVPKNTVNLKPLAKISKDAAEKSALARVNGSVSKGVLAADNGCLVYSFRITRPGRTVAEAVIVDAGTGNVLSPAAPSRAGPMAERLGAWLKPHG